MQSRCSRSAQSHSFLVVSAGSPSSGTRHEAEGTFSTSSAYWWAMWKYLLKIACTSKRSEPLGRWIGLGPERTRARLGLRRVARRRQLALGFGAWDGMGGKPASTTPPISGKTSSLKWSHKPRNWRQHQSQHEATSTISRIHTQENEFSKTSPTDYCHPPPAPRARIMNVSRVSIL